MNRPRLLVAIGAVILWATVVSARPRERPEPPQSPDPTTEHIHSTSLGPTQPADTVYFGGTRWDPVDMRWEALLDSVWTFETGVASVINTDSTLKAVGLHSLMEGWYGFDFTIPTPDFNPFRRSQSCAIEGWSLWAGLTKAEADSLGWIDGEGYGNDWRYDVVKTFQYPGSGTIDFSFDYRLETELEYDFLRVYIDTSGTGVIPPVSLVDFDGVIEGTESLALTPGVNLPTTAGPIRIIFQATSDGAWSDEDGFFVSTCGHSSIDNIHLAGAITDSSDFESGMDGWEPLSPLLMAERDWSDIRATASLDPPSPGCTCSFGDSVLAFVDLTTEWDGHRIGQFNITVSPWIDLAEAGVTEYMGRFVEYSGYERRTYLGGRDHVVTVVYVRWKPDNLPSPALGATDVQGFFWGSGSTYLDSCFCRPGWQRLDLTRAIPPDADEIQIGIGFDYRGCQSPAPFTQSRDDLSGCTGLSNETPWFDDIRVGIHNGPLPPAMWITDNATPADAFPTDPSPINLISSPGPFDSQGGWDLIGVPSRYDPFPTSVHVIFRVRPGPGIDTARYTNWISGFSDEGSGWFSARMDSGWVGTFHEEDPQYDPGDTLNATFPDDLFTPGTRIDLFYRWATEAGPGATQVLPDTTGGNYLEMEILPSSIAWSGEPGNSPTFNNRVLLVNEILSNNDTLRKEVEGALSHLLPGGSANFESRAWDRVDNGGGYTVTHFDRYDIILWLGKRTHLNRYGELIREWLDCVGGGSTGNNGCERGFFFTGTLSSYSQSSLIHALGIEQVDDLIIDPPFCLRVLGKPGNAFGEGYQSYLHIPYRSSLLTPTTTPHPDSRHESNLAYEEPVTGPVDAASVSTFHWVRTDSVKTGYWRAVVDGFPLTILRSAPDCTGDSDTTAIRKRLSDILAWFDADPPTPVDLLAFKAVRKGGAVILGWRTAGTPADHAGFNVFRETDGDQRLALTSALLSGRTDYEFTDDDPPDGAARYWLSEMLRDGTTKWHGPVSVGPRQFRFVVSQNAPNPFFAGTHIRLELPVAQRVTVRVFNIVGQEIARPHDGALPAGEHEIAWSGRDLEGRRIAAGIYFYRVETENRSVTRKMVKIGN